MDNTHPSRKLISRWLLAAGTLAVAVWPVADARAVITIVNGYNGTRSVMMQVGTAAAGVIDTVQFNVGGGATGNSLVNAPNPHGNSSPIAASTGGVLIRMTMQVPNGQRYTMSATAPTVLTCVSGGCGAATIPFSAISWTMSVAPSGANAPYDFQNGTFSGTGAAQSLTTVPLTTPDSLTGGSGATVDFQGTMNFTYANTTAYPAGNYSGTVVYTATLL